MPHYHLVLPLKKEHDFINIVDQEMTEPRLGDALFFTSREDALKFCQIAKQPKFHLLKETVRTQQKAASVYSTLYTMQDHFPELREAKVKIAKQYQLLTNDKHAATTPCSFIVSYAEAKSYLILKVESDIVSLDKDPLLLFEHTHFQISRRLTDGNALHKPNHIEFITLSNDPFENDPNPKNTDFTIQCRRVPKKRVLSWANAELYRTEEQPIQSIPLSKISYQLTLLHNYVQTPTPETLAELLKYTRPFEWHKLFKQLSAENSASMAQMLQAKETLFAAHIKDNSNKYEQAEEQHISLSWKIAFIFTLGVAFIFYAGMQFYKKLNERVPYFPQGVVQKEFDMTAVMKGKLAMHKYRQTQVETNSSPQLRIKDYYSDFERYKAHLETKQSSSLLNNVNELRKHIQFKPDQMALVTSSLHQNYRWGLFEEIGNGKRKANSASSKLLEDSRQQSRIRC